MTADPLDPPVTPVDHTAAPADRTMTDSAGRTAERPPASASRIESPSLAELAAERIGDLVFRGELRPGDRLVEEQLCERLGVSRAPVREGLRILEGAGLVVRRPRAGVRVIPLTPRDVFEILTFRVGLERMAIEHLYRYTDDVTAVDTSDLDAALAQLNRAFTGQADSQTRLDASHAFHVALVGLSGNSRLAASYELLAMQVKLCMAMNLRTRDAQETPEQNVERHRALKDAVLSGDLTRALQAMDEHGHDAFAGELLEESPRTHS